MAQNTDCNYCKNKIKHTGCKVCGKHYATEEEAKSCSCPVRNRTRIMRIVAGTLLVVQTATNLTKKQEVHS